MREIRFNSIGFLIGYFVLFAPINLAIHNTSLIYALFHSIFGVVITILIETYNSYWDVYW